jgi:hypothetical protein
MWNIKKSMYKFNFYIKTMTYFFIRRGGGKGEGEGG